MFVNNAKYYNEIIISKGKKFGSSYIFAPTPPAEYAWFLRLHTGRS